MGRVSNRKADAIRFPGSPAKQNKNCYARKLPRRVPVSTLPGVEQTPPPSRIHAAKACRYQSDIVFGFEQEPAKGFRITLRGAIDKPVFIFRHCSFIVEDARPAEILCAIFENSRAGAQSRKERQRVSGLFHRSVSLEVSQKRKTPFFAALRLCAEMGQ